MKHTALTIAVVAATNLVPAPAVDMGAAVVGVSVARAEDLITVKTGTVSGSGGDMFDTLPVAVTNHTNKVFEYVNVDCGFFRGDTLLGTAPTHVQNLKPNQTGYASAVHYNSERKVRPDHGDCHVNGVKEAPGND